MKYTLDLPYPEITVAEKNPEHAKMILSNIGGTDSEMSAVALYCYDHLVTGEYPEISRAFHAISIVEMRHLSIFGDVAQRLGADPRLWEMAGRRKKYWSADKIRYSTKLRRIFTDALFSENMAVEKYSKQARVIRDPGVVEVLNRIILDEKEHIKILNELLKST